MKTKFVNIYDHLYYDLNNLIKLNWKIILVGVLLSVLSAIITAMIVGTDNQAMSLLILIQVISFAIIYYSFIKSYTKNESITLKNDVVNKMNNFDFIKTLLFFIGVLALNSIALIYLDGSQGEIAIKQININWASAGLFALITLPILETVLYQGVIIKVLNKYNTGFAVVVSTILFVVSSGNHERIFYKIILGLVLGYISTKYSLFTSIKLRLLSECFFEGIVLIFSMFNKSLTYQTLYLIIGIPFILFGIYYVFKNVQMIIENINEQKSNVELYKELISNKWFVVYIIIISVLSFL